MKTLRILFSIIGLFVIVCALAIGAFVFFIDPNKLKPMIAEEVMKQTGYQLTIEGQLSWSFYPRLGVKVERMTVSAPHQSIPFADLRNVNIATELLKILGANQTLQGDVYISEMKLMNMHIQRAHIGLHWQNHLLTLQPMVAELYDGYLTGIAHGRQLSSIPSWDWDVQFNHIQLKPLLEDVEGINSTIKISGLTQIKLQIATQGRSKEDVLKNLNGYGTLSVNNGIVEGIDFNYLVQSADALINHKPLTVPVNINQTVFNSFMGSAVIKNGIINTDNLVLVSPTFTTKGEGEIDLINQTLNYQLQITPLYTTKIKWAVPVLITGNLHHPSVRLDMLHLNVLMTKEQLEKVKSAVEKEIKKLPAKVDQLMNHLFGQ